MSDAAAGTGAGGTGDAGAGQGGAGAGQGAGAGGQSTPWHGLTDANDAAYVANKGWNSAADMLKSYRGAEQLIGADPASVVKLPRPDDPAGYRALMGRLGMPEAPDKYDFGKPAEGATRNPTFESWAREAFHKAGLTSKQAQELVALNDAFAVAQANKLATEYQAAVAADKQTLAAEWGGGYERMMNAAKTAATTLGFTGPMIDAMERALGYAGTQKFLAGLGQKLGEDKLETGGGSGGTGGFSGTMTPAEAKAAWDAKTLDRDFVKALQDNQHPGHKAAAELQTKLFNIMFPQQK